MMPDVDMLIDPSSYAYVVVAGDRTHTSEARIVSIISIAGMKGYLISVDRWISE
jgi:hypothetical protein